MSDYRNLSARDVCQVLREVILGRKDMTKASHHSWDEDTSGPFIVDVEGWRISIHNDCGEPAYCEESITPDGRRWSLESSKRIGADPIALLSTWEHGTLKLLLKSL